MPGDGFRRRWWTAALRTAAAGALAAISVTAAADQRIVFPSYDPPSGPPLIVVGHWQPAADGNAPSPAVALFHGCGGAYDRHGNLDRRMREYGAWLHARGWSVLVVDSYTPRGETSICTQRNGHRRVTQVNRRRDALAAIDWLAQRPDVDPKRIGLIGWSNGGSTVLAATNLHHPDVAAASLRPAFGVAFYPGCEAELARGYAPDADMLLLVGEADDWTPAAPCHRLSAKAARGSTAGGDASFAATASANSKAVTIEGYAGAYHGFDSDQPLRLRKDVPNGAHPGHGVHVGGDPQALRRSREHLAEFLARY